MRLVTWNIHKGIGGTDRRYLLERITELLRALKPDLVCLQEVTFDLPRTGRHHQPALVSEALPDLVPFFQPTVHWKRGGYGNLILSRWPLAERHRLSLRMGGRKVRGAQWAVVATPHGPLRLANWHLGLTDGERLWQARHLMANALWRGHERWPTVLAGDTNDWRGLLGPLVLERHGLRHASHPPSRFRTFPAAWPVLAIDKVFHCARVEVHRAHVPQSALARLASDHLPVVAELALAGASSG